MKQNIHNQPIEVISELRTITPELGLFVISGTFDEVSDQAKILTSDYKLDMVRPSSFDRILRGGKARRLGWFSL